MLTLSESGMTSNSSRAILTSCCEILLNVVSRSSDEKTVSSSKADSAEISVPS